MVQCDNMLTCVTEYADFFAAAVAAELRAERARKGITLDALAAASDTAKSSVQRYLKGTREIPITAFLALCQALEVSPVEIFDRASKSVEQ